MDYFAAIRAFLQSAELGSFSKAALHLEVKTSTVSRHISELEQDLGIALFNRSTRGIRLTEGGRTFLEHALRVMAVLDEARTVTSALNESPQGVLRVSMPRAYGKQYIVPCLPDFMQQFPRIDVDIVFSDQSLNLIDAELDLAIRMGVLEDSQLVARRLATYQRLLCASPDLIAHYGLPRTPAQLSSLPAIQLASINEERWWLEAKEKESTREPLRFTGRLRVDDDEAALRLVESGCGVGLLPGWLVANALDEGRLIPVLKDWQVREASGSLGIWAVYTHKKTVSSKVRAFIDYFSQILPSAHR